MRLMKCFVTVCGILYGFMSTVKAGGIYPVEHKTLGNVIVLDITNKRAEEISGLLVRVSAQPKWVTINDARMDGAKLAPDSSGQITVHFEVSAEAKSGMTGTIEVQLLSGETVILQKSFKLQVSVPHRYELSQNFPNPFNPATTIQYQLPADGFVSLKVFDILGREVTTLVHEEQKADYHKATFDAGGLASGTYFYRLQAGTFTSVRRLLILK
jgi:hypothetical protein